MFTPISKPDKHAELLKKYLKPLVTGFLYLYNLLTRRQNCLRPRTIIHRDLPGGVAQSVGHLTRKSEVLGFIPGLATYFRFSFR